MTAFLTIPPAQFKLVLDSVIWAFKHTMRNVADTGLGILYQMLQNVAIEDAAAQSFYQTYYTEILQHLFSVVTDSSHTAGRLCSVNSHTSMHARTDTYKHIHTEILQHLFSVVTDSSHTAGRLCSVNSHTSMHARTDTYKHTHTDTATSLLCLFEDV